jgi:hypothetical protein
MRMMPLTVLVSLVFLGPKPAGAQLYKSLQQSAQCVLDYTADTGSREAVNLIRSACNDLYGRYGLLNEANRQYDICLLQHLPGVQNRLAAKQIASACRTVHPLF